jgi:hypothetical protein
VGHGINHISWEIINRNHLAFKLSLHSVLDRKTVKLSRLFKGAITNIPEACDHVIDIPDIMSLREIRSHYPKTAQSIDYGEFILNGPQAPSFDAFALVKNETGEPLLMCMQMKFAYHPEGQHITNGLVDLEYSKVNYAVYRYLPSTDFIFIMLCRCLGKIDKEGLPSKSVVVVEDQMQEYYGKSLYQRLKFEA